MSTIKLTDDQAAELLAQHRRANRQRIAREATSRYRNTEAGKKTAREAAQRYRQRKKTARQDSVV